MAVNRFAIGQRVQVVRVGAWNGTPANKDIAMCWMQKGVVCENNGDTIGVEIRTVFAKYLGVVQFLPNELAVLDNTSGDSVE